jgi:basic membrane protein A
MPLRIPRRHRARYVTGACVGIAAAITAVVLLQPAHHTPAPPKVVANDFSGRATACLATDTATAGKTDNVTKVWTSMQSAGNRSGKNIQQLIQPATSADQAQPYLAGLISQRCDLIVTVGPTFGQAIPALAKADPAARFTAIDSAISSPPPGVTLLTSDQAVSAIGQQVQALQHATAQQN